MRRGALLALVLLTLAPPAPAQQGSLDVIQQPTYTVGDFWQYRIAYPVENFTYYADQTVRVVAAEDFHGTPAYRMVTQSVQDIPGDPQSGDLHTTINRTDWASRDGLRALRWEVESTETRATAQYRITTRVHENWTFHQPMDLYLFPILKDDAWVVLTNATVERLRVLRTHVQGNEPREVPQWQNGTLYQTSATSWLRQDTCGRSNDCSSAGEFPGIVLVSRSGNATVRDFYSPAVGNLVRREILNETGTLVQVSSLVAYKLAAAPGGPGPRPGGDLTSSFGSWAPLAGAAVVGVVLALGLLALWSRRSQAPPPPAEAREPPADPSAGPPEPPGDPPGGPPGGPS